MREGGERRGAEPDRLALELGRERRRKQMLETSVFELRNTVAELEKRLSSVEDEGSEWKTRYETQVELNKQLERQINILQDKMELIRGNPAGRNKLSIVRTFDQMPVGSLKEVLKQLEEEKKSLQNQLKDYELRLEQEAKAYHKANDERRMYLLEILQTSATLQIVERQKTDALTGKGENQILRQSTVSLQRSEIHADKKIKGCLEYHHLWSMENLKAIYSTGDTCRIKILVTSCFPEMVVATHAYRQ
ncbi:coiled-coil domain-containing protein 169 isoform X2 [Haliaeetus albicilla]|uniref:coiled-coil domain-containing protein 169 isoform X2 n=1 Tax=Haliaeetus albicilla TaxID=8969 RepID=UPI0037E70CCC